MEVLGGILMVPVLNGRGTWSICLGSSGRCSRRWHQQVRESRDRGGFQRLTTTFTWPLGATCVCMRYTDYTAAVNGRCRMEVGALACVDAC